MAPPLTSAPASVALNRWTTTRAAELDQLAEAHRAVGGRRRGRRWATQQINQAYAMLLSSQFQGFCRDLHSECVDRLVELAKPSVLQPTLRKEFMRNRKLDRGNPTPGNIGADFYRLGIAIWAAARNDNARNRERQRKLEELAAWRNAIAHQDFAPSPTLTGSLTLLRIRHWRSVCNELARSFDRVVQRYLESVSDFRAR